MASSRLADTRDDVDGDDADGWSSIEADAVNANSAVDAAQAEVIMFGSALCIMVRMFD